MILGKTGSLFSVTDCFAAVVLRMHSVGQVVVSSEIVVLSTSTSISTITQPVAMVDAAVEAAGIWFPDVGEVEEFGRGGETGNLEIVVGVGESGGRGLDGKQWFSPLGLCAEPSR